MNRFELLFVISSVVTVLSVLFGIVIAIDKGFGYEAERNAYDIKCTANSGLIYKPLGEIKRCIKKDIFIDMDNK